MPNTSTMRLTPTFCPLNALRFTDLPEVAAMIAAREIVSLRPLPKEYGLTSAVYAPHGGKTKIRKAQALPDALQVWMR